MGIRWYGWEITPEEKQQADIDPWPVIRLADGRYDDPDWGVIDLDKAWAPLQTLFWDPTGDGTSSPRPSLQLIAGDVTYPGRLEDGYVPHIATLGVDTVQAVARDLVAVTDADLRFPGGARDSVWPVDLLRHFVTVAQEFVADAAGRGHCVIYVIR